VAYDYDHFALQKVDLCLWKWMSILWRCKVTVHIFEKIFEFGEHLEYS